MISVEFLPVLFSLPVLALSAVPNSQFGAIRPGPSKMASPSTVVEFPGIFASFSAWARGNKKCGKNPFLIVAIPALISHTDPRGGNNAVRNTVSHESSL